MIRTVELLRNGPPASLMDLALYYGNETYVSYLLNNGYPVNDLINDMTALGRSLLYPNGEITLRFLKHGADPTIECPSGPTRPLTLLATRPVGSHMLAIAKNMIELGATSTNDAISHLLLYRRAVIEAQFDVADLLVSHDAQTANINGELLMEFLAQNTHESLRGISYVLRSISKPHISDVLVNTKRKETAYHVLCSVNEDIRDDSLNLSILQILLQRFSSTNILDYTNERDWTPMVCAVINGNHYALDALLRAGASLRAGRRSPKLEALGRLITPKIFTREFQGLSNQHRRSRRYEDNSMRMMIVLLKHEYRIHGVSNKTAREAIERALPTWRSMDFILSCMTAALPKDLLERGMTVTIAENELYLQEKGGSCQPLGQHEATTASSGYMESVDLSMWNSVAKNWGEMVGKILE